MKKKLIITEGQLERLKTNLVEDTLHSNVIKQMKEDLDKNYTPIAKYMREGGEYFERPSPVVPYPYPLINDHGFRVAICARVPTVGN